MKDANCTKSLKDAGLAFALRTLEKPNDFWKILKEETVSIGGDERYQDDVYRASFAAIPLDKLATWAKLVDMLGFNVPGRQTPNQMWARQWHVSLGFSADMPCSHNCPTCYLKTGTPVTEEQTKEALQQIADKMKVNLPEGKQVINCHVCYALGDAVLWSEDFKRWLFHWNDTVFDFPMDVLVMTNEWHKEFFDKGWRQRIHLLDWEGRTFLDTPDNSEYIIIFTPDNFPRLLRFIELNEKSKHAFRFWPDMTVAGDADYVSFVKDASAALEAKGVHNSRFVDPSKCPKDGRMLSWFITSKGIEWSPCCTTSLRASIDAWPGVKTMCAFCKWGWM